MRWEVGRKHRFKIASRKRQTQPPLRTQLSLRHTSQIDTGRKSFTCLEMRDYYNIPCQRWFYLCAIEEYKSQHRDNMPKIFVLNMTASYHVELLLCIDSACGGFQHQLIFDISSKNYVIGTPGRLVQYWLTEQLRIRKCSDTVFHIND